MRKQLLFFVLCIIVCQTMTLDAYGANPSIVGNIDSRQVDNKIVITYDLEKKADITIYYSIDGGSRYKRILQISGDVGSNVSPGLEKTATWDVLSEINELSGDIIFQVQAVDCVAQNVANKNRQRELRRAQIEPFYFGLLQFGIPITKSMDYLGEPIPLKSTLSLGFTLGWARRFGVYATILMRMEEKEPKSDIPYYMYNSALAVGGVARLFKGCYLYAGPAYMWSMLSGVTTEGSYHVELEELSKYSKFAVDAGVLCKISFLSISAGVTSTVVNNPITLVNVGVGLGF